MTDADSLRSLAGVHRDRTIGRRIVVLDECASTNDAARDLAVADGAEVADGTVVIAARQTAGRGTRGRRWWSPPESSLALSVIVAPRPPLAQPPGLTLAAALAAIDAAIERGARVRWKWPNDVVSTSGAKVAGVLAETVSGATPVHVVGVGMNVLDSKDAPPEDVTGAVASLAGCGAVIPGDGSPAAFVIPFLDHLEAAIDVLREHGAAPIASRCNARSFLEGRDVSLRRGGVTETGRFLGLRPDLAVRFRLTSGEIREWPGEQVELVAPR